MRKSQCPNLLSVSHTLIYIKGGLGLFFLQEEIRELLSTVRICDDHCPSLGVAIYEQDVRNLPPRYVILLLFSPSPACGFCAKVDDKNEHG